MSQTWITPGTFNLRVYAMHQDAQLYAPRPGDAGIDLYTLKEIEIPAHSHHSKPKWLVKVNTGIHVEIPEGWYGRRTQYG